MMQAFNLILYRAMTTYMYILDHQLTWTFNLCEWRGQLKVLLFQLLNKIIVLCSLRST